MENKKWTREEAELQRDQILEEIRTPKEGWTNIHTSEEDLKLIEEELNKLIDEEEARQNNKSKTI